MNETPVHRPIAWRVHPDDAARFAAKGEHCEAGTCRLPVAVVTWRWFRSKAAGRVIVAEHLVCLGHGLEFAQRHRIEIEPPPPEKSLR